MSKAPKTRSEVIRQSGDAEASFFSTKGNHHLDATRAHSQLRKSQASRPVPFMTPGTTEHQIVTKASSLSKPTAPVVMPRPTAVK